MKDRTFFLRQRGFTLIELVMVIVIMGVIGGTVAVFMKGPIDSYFATARRAGLTDVADTAVRRMARDVRKALPNSIHAPTSQCVEFIPTKFGGRYRADVDASGTGDILNFTAADSSFDMLGSNSTLTDQTMVTGDWITVYNLGITGSDAYNQDNTSAIGSIGTGSLSNETKINITSKLFPLASGGNRFHVIPKDEKVVALVCSGGKLYRTANTAMSKTADGSSCPTSATATFTVATLANNVSSCNFSYSGSDLQRNALVQMTLQFTDSGETTSLYHEVHVNNTP